MSARSWVHSREGWREGSTPSRRTTGVKFVAAAKEPADGAHRLLNTLSIGLREIKSSVLLARLSEKLAASAGAACHTTQASVSSVLKAMDVPLEYAIGTLRLSTGRHTTEAEVREAAKLIIEEAHRQWAEDKA